MKAVSLVFTDSSADFTDFKDKRKASGASVKVCVICGSLPVPWGVPAR
jgi:hypothetical protein